MGHLVAPGPHSKDHQEILGQVGNALPKSQILGHACPMKVLLVIPLLFLVACSNPYKEAEEDRRNLHLAQFYFDQGIPSKSVAHAKKIKPDSPQYAAAQEFMYLDE